MNRFKNIFTVFIALSIQTLCSSASAQSLSASNSASDTLVSTYFDKEFSFSYNINWTLDTSDKTNASAMLKYFFPEPGFKSNFNFILQYTGENDTTTIEDFLYMSTAQMEEYLPEFKPGSVEYVVDGQDTSLQFEFTGKINETPLHWLQQYSLKNGKILIVTFTSSNQLFQGHLKEAKRIIATAKLRD